LAREFGQVKEGMTDRWNEKKVMVMKEIMRAKMLQHEDVREALRSTGDASIEKNHPDDYYWGTGADGSGENVMGKIFLSFTLPLGMKGYLSLLSKYKKMMAIGTGLLIFGLLFWAPWMADDGGERAVWAVNDAYDEHGNTREFGRLSKRNPSECDGMHALWVPFGQLVTNCQRDWYVTFWGGIY
jgi:hypothetical protein